MVFITRKSMNCMGEISRRNFLTRSLLVAGASMIPPAVYGSRILESMNVTKNIGAKNAVELLTAFSGVSARQHAPLFKYYGESRIVSFEIYAVGTESTNSKYSGEDEIWKQVNNILVIKTADGREGISGVTSYHEAKFGDEYLQDLKGVSEHLISLKTLDPVEIGLQLNKTRPELSDSARSSIDIALWDLAAKKADLPLYKLLGAKRDSIESYASLPFYDTLPEYIEKVNEYSNLGYTVFKFHVWGQLKKDYKLVDLVQQTYADTNYKFMMDLEGAYDLKDAIKLGEKMDQGQFIWFEAPVGDELLEQYTEIRNKFFVSIIPAGYNVYSAEFLKKGIEAGAWDAGRFDATTMGGLTRAIENLIIANEANLTIEIQSWGHTLTQVVNLHLMLANEQTTYFEAPMPKEAYEFGMKNGIPFDKGMVSAPKGSGLGIEVDWDRLSTADYYVNSKV
ncbi:MAG: hypothetical protein IH948_07075 [Bacteroidetes bacterium]|nr:hypothetical protein [Bacteroidota bacterium]